MKRIFIALTACLGAAWIVAGAQAQQPAYVLPGPAPSLGLANCAKQTPKMSIARASFDRFKRTTSILAPISTLASGIARIELLGGGRVTEFTAPIDSRRGLIRVTRGIDAAQARAATAILTLRYDGDADTRPQTLRLRAALRAARLSSSRPVIDEVGELTAAGAITKSARGVVRLTLEWVNGSDGSISVIERLAPIVNGRWGVRSQLTPEVQAAINNR